MVSAFSMHAIELQRAILNGAQAFSSPRSALVIDGNSAPRNGKAEQRKAVEQWESMVAETHGGGVGAITVHEDDAATMVESWAEVTFQDGQRVKMEEVGVQKWQGDKIIHERFYYTMQRWAKGGLVDNA